MPDPINTPPRPTRTGSADPTPRPLPGVPTVGAATEHPGTGISVDTGISTDLGTPDNAVSDVMERRPRTVSGTTPAFVRTTTFERTNGRSVVDVRADAGGSVIRGSRETRDPAGNAVRTDVGTVGVDGNAVAISVERTTDVTRGGLSINRVTGGTLRTDATSGTVTGTFNARGTTTRTGDDGNSRGTSFSTEILADGTRVGGNLEGSVETRGGDGNVRRRDGRVEGNVTSDGLDGTLRGRLVTTGNGVNNEVGADVGGRVDRTGIHGNVRLDGVHDRTVADGRTVVRGNIGVDENGPTGNVDFERTRGTGEDRNTIRGNVNGDVRGVHGNVDAERVRGTAGNTRTVGGNITANLGGDGSSVVLTGRTSTVSTTNNVVTTRVLVGTGTISLRDLRGEVTAGNTVEDAARNGRRELSGSLRGGLSDGRVSVTADGRATGSSGSGSGSVTWRSGGDVTIDADGTRGTLSGSRVE